MRKIVQMTAIAVAVMSPAIAHAQLAWHPSQSSASNQRVVMINGRRCVQQTQRDGRVSTYCDNNDQYNRGLNNVAWPTSQRQRDIDRDREIARQREIAVARERQIAVAREREIAIAREREIERARDLRREREIRAQDIERTRELQRQREVSQVRAVQAQRERDRWVQARQNNNGHDNGRRHDDHDNGRGHDNHGHDNWHGHS